MAAHALHTNTNAWGVLKPPHSGLIDYLRPMNPLLRTIISKTGLPTSEVDFVLDAVPSMILAALANRKYMVRDVDALALQFDGWICEVCKRAAKDYARSWRAQQRRDATYSRRREESVREVDRMVHEEALRRLNARIDQLSSLDRDIVRYKQIGLNTRQIAQLTGLTEQRVKDHWRRILETLRGGWGGGTSSPDERA